MIEVKNKQNFISFVYRNGLSLVNLSNEIGISQSNLSNVISGRNGISPQKAKAIVDILNVEFEDLFNIKFKENVKVKERS